MRNIASVCLEIGYPTLASVPHSVINGYKRVLAVAVETDYSFPLAEKVCTSNGLNLLQLWGRGLMVSDSPLEVHNLY